MCPEWPLVAPGPEPADADAVAVVDQERVVAASGRALAEGVRPGLRRREAEARCPGLEVRRRDEAEEVRAFEPVLEVLEGLGAPVATRAPGWAALPTRGPARYFGGERALVDKVVAALDGLGVATGRWRVGVGDGELVATEAARQGAIVARGRGAAFLAPLGIDLVGRTELVGVLRRLGIDTLGAFAALGEAEVGARFGADGALAHRLASGLGDEPSRPRPTRADLSVRTELDPPAADVEAVAFVARGLAVALAARLSEAGLVCTRLRVEVVSTTGEQIARRWSGDGGVDPAVVAERLRWQLEAWTTVRGRCGGAGQDVGEVTPWSGVESVALVPEEVEADLGRQLDLWSRPRAGEGQVARAVARVQGMLGHSSVARAVLVGGRGPGERVRLVAFGDPYPGVGATRPETARTGGPAPATCREGPDRPRRGARGSRRGAGVPRRETRTASDAPWPGRLPPPNPAVVPSAPPPVELLDPGGARVLVDARGEVSAVPAALLFEDGGERRVTRWAGPWPVDERWWEGAPRRRRRARIQVLTAEGGAYLLAVERGRWVLEGTYD